jgi:hypothetical protein
MKTGAGAGASTFSLARTARACCCDCKRARLLPARDPAPSDATPGDATGATSFFAAPAPGCAPTPSSAGCAP